MKIDEKTEAKIIKQVDKYIDGLAEYTQIGTKKVLVDSGLKNDHDTLLEFYKQKFFLDLKTDNERFVAKQYFKSKLPYREWRERISKTPGLLAQQIEDFEERYNPNYAKKRRTPRGGLVP